MVRASEFLAAGWGSDGVITGFPIVGNSAVRIGTMNGATGSAERT
jgi:hypothetical protein